MPEYVIAYDVHDDRRRERIARVLSRYGERIQRSVFVAFLDSEEHLELRIELGEHLRVNDQLEFFPVDARAKAKHVSWHDDPHVGLTVRVV